MSYTPVPDTPIASSLIAMTAAALEQCDLPERDMMVARIARVGRSRCAASFLYVEHGRGGLHRANSRRRTRDPGGHRPNHRHSPDCRRHLLDG